MTISNVPTYLKKNQRHSQNHMGQKILHKNSYTIPKGSLDEKRSEHAETKKNASQSKSHLSLDWNH
jgi:hypothetical protein